MGIMGVIYTVACRDCKVVRDLDKFYGCRNIKDRKEAKDLCDQYANSVRDRFCAALLASFMAAHIGHNCTVFTDMHEELSEELDPMFGAKTSVDGDFWKEST